MIIAKATEKTGIKWLLSSELRGDLSVKEKRRRIKA